MSITIRQLRAFSLLAKTKSFTQAAVHLNISQSAISGLIKELESSLGIKLVDRNTRIVQLSEVGREFHSTTIKVLQDLDTAVTEIVNIKSLKYGVVRVATPQFMACTIMPKLIASFQQQHHNIHIKLVDCAIEDVLIKVMTGEVSLGISPERTTSAEVVGETLMKLPFMVAYNKNHPISQEFANQRAVPWQSIISYPLITLKGQFTEKLIYDLSNEVHSFTLNPKIEVSFMTTALSMVSAGLGIVVCQSYEKSLAKQFGVKMKILGSPILMRQFKIYRVMSKPLTPTAKAFHDFIKKNIKLQNF